MPHALIIIRYPCGFLNVLGPLETSASTAQSCSHCWTHRTGGGEATVPCTNHLCHLHRGTLLQQQNHNDRECLRLPEPCKTAHCWGFELCSYVGNACLIGNKVERKTTNVPAELEQPEELQLTWKTATCFLYVKLCEHTCTRWFNWCINVLQLWHKQTGTAFTS